MAEELDKETQRLTDFARKFQESLAESGDLSSRLLQTFKELNGIGSKNNADLKKAEDFTRKILLNSEARARLQNAALNLEKNLQDQILKLEMARFDSELNKQLVADRTRELEEKAAETMEKELALIQKTKDVTEQVMDLRGAIKDIENEILSATKEKERLEKNTANREEALTKAVAAQKINETAISENLAKQNSIKSKLLAVEKEITAAQSDSLGYSHDYEVLLKKQSYLKNSLTGLEKVGTGYLNDRLRLETRSEKIRKELEISVENENRVQRELYDMQSKLVDEKQKEADLTKKMNKAQAEAEKLQTERLGLEKRIKEIQESGLSGEEIDLMVKALNTKIKENQEAQKAAKYQAGFLAYMKDTAGSSGGVLGNLAGMANQVKEMANKFKTIPAQFLFLHALIKEGLDLFVKLDKAAEKFREETGFSNTQMTALRRNAEVINREFQYMGVSIEGVYKSAKALTDVFGRATLLTKETLTNVSLLAANLGVAEKDSAEVLANFQGLGGATEKAAMNVIKVGAGISESAGVPFKLVMNDIANASADTLNLVGATPSKLMKAAIAARALGTDINKIAATQQKLLNYSSSITSELEASALLGKSISFQKARQLAYDGDAVGAAKATLDTIKKAGDFNKMTVYQKKALAEASGMELKDITKMLAVEKQRDAILLNGTDEQKKKLLAQEAELENLKKMADLESEDLVKQNEKAIMQQKMQGLVTQMTNLLQSVALELGSALEPIIRIGAALLVPVLKMITGFIKGFLAPITKFTEKLTGGAETGDKFAKTLAKAAPIIEKMVNGAEKLGEGVAIFYTYFYKAQLVGSIIVASFTKILSVSTRISSIVTKIQGGFASIVSLISASKGVTMLSNAIASIGSMFSRIAGVIQPITGFFSGILSKISVIIKPITSLFGIATKTTGVISRVMGILGAGISTFLKYAGPIGMVISAIQFAVEYISELIDIWASEDMSIGDKILTSLAAIPKALYNVMVKPFIDAIDWVLEYFGINFSVGEFFSEWVSGMMNLGTMMIQPLVNSMYELWEAVTNIFDGKDIGMNILKGLWSVGKLITQALFWPFTAAWGLISGWLGESPSELGEAIVTGIKSVAGFVLDALTWPFKTAMNFVSGLFGGDGELGNSIIDGVKSIAGFIIDVLTSPFRTVMNILNTLFEGGGEFIPKLLDGIKSAASLIFDVLTYPFRNIMDFVSGLFGGDGQLGTTIIEGIKNVASLIFDIIVSPFKKAIDFVKGLPFVGKLFGGSDDISKQAAPQEAASSNVQSTVVTVEHLDELRDAVMELTSAVANLGAVTQTATTGGTTLNTSALESKLDTLTQLLVDGAVRVYLDGKDVSAAMSSTGR